MTQETMLRLWRIAPDWQADRAALGTWLYRVASNLCIDRLRRRRELGSDAVPELADDAPGPVAPARGRATGPRRCDAALAALPDRQRLAIVLRHFEDRSNPEIAEILEVSVEAVESLLARAPARARRRASRRARRTGVHRWLETTIRMSRDATTRPPSRRSSPPPAREHAAARRPAVGDPRRRRRGAGGAQRRRPPRRTPPAGAVRPARRRSAAGAASRRSAPAPRSASGSASPATSTSTARRSGPARPWPTATADGSPPSSTSPRWSPEHGRPRAPPPRLKWALVASLGLNLAVVGLIAGALVKGPPPRPLPGIALWHYARALPDPYRRDLGRALRDNRRDWIGPREALRGQRERPRRRPDRRALRPGGGRRGADPRSAAHRRALGPRQPRCCWRRSSGCRRTSARPMPRRWPKGATAAGGPRRRRRTGPRR